MIQKFPYLWISGINIEKMTILQKQIQWNAHQNSNTFFTKIKWTIFLSFWMDMETQNPK